MQIRTLDFNVLGDERGLLISLEENKNIPFEIKRVYYIFDTKKGVRRGFHAHKKLNQVAICVSGSCKFLLDNGNQKEHIVLDKSNIGLVIKDMIWHEMYDFSENCVLMILADDFYGEDDYIRDYNKFVELMQ
jgi:dTDP-4-dehydrorhamnose 3,5-epimerase-like enzyme